MIRTRSLTILTAVVAALGSGCDEGDELLGLPPLSRDVVAGFYELARLTFDPEGDLVDEVDVLAAFEPADRPQLNLVRTENTFQIIFQDPTSGKFEVANGPYTLLAEGVRLEFPSDSVAERILFPTEIDLAFDSVAGTLAFQGPVVVSFARLRELVPELEDEPLADRLDGQLEVTFVRSEG